MRRLASHLFTLCSAVSLLLCVLAVASWARGYAATDRVSGTWATPGRPIVERTGEVLSGRGQLSLAYVVFAGGRPLSTGVRWAVEPPQALLPTFLPSRSLVEQAGFRLVRYRDDAFDAPDPATRRAAYHAVVVPAWFVVLVTSILPAISVSRRRRRLRRVSRIARGLCPDCGYDLRASTGCCPECGMSNAAPRENAGI